jgi:hypothetical protein
MSGTSTTPTGWLSSDFIEVSIFLRPLPSSTWLTSCWAMRTSRVSIADEAHKHPGPLTIVDVRLDGLPLRHHTVDAHTVIVSPQVPPEYGRLEVLCVHPRLASDLPEEPLKWLTLTDFSPEDNYGLQPASRRLQRPTP